MERIVFFGKGGIGKSTIASNVSAVLAAEGKKVLHVGCDPKHDSTAPLLRGRMIQPIVDRITTTRGIGPADIVEPSHLGVDCVEAGGPEAGVGCGGRGISRMFEIFQAAELLAPGRYDVAVYDVLGDVVCGGFASPLRRGIGEKVVIVASEEVMSLYAANNIARAVVHYADNGVGLAGIVYNLRDKDEDRGPIERFAAIIDAPILGYVPRDPLVREAEYRRMTVVEHAPGAPIVAAYRALARSILAIPASALAQPTPLDEVRFHELTQRKFAAAEGGAAPKPAPAAGVIDGLLDPARLRRGAADPEERRRAYERELRAGIKAVRLGKVLAAEAARRLRASFPHEARDLGARDLLT